MTCHRCRDNHITREWLSHACNFMLAIINIKISKQNEKLFELSKSHVYLLLDSANHAAKDLSDCLSGSNELVSRPPLIQR